MMHMQLNMLQSFPLAKQWPDQQQPWGWQGHKNRKLQGYLDDNLNNKV